MMSRLNRFTLVSVLALSTGVYGSAFAQDEDEGMGGGEEGEPGEEPAAEEPAAEEPAAEPAAEEPAAEEPMEGEGGAPGLTLKKGGIAVDVNVEVNMSKEAVGKPFSIAPDIWYGVNDKLTVGLAHSTMANTGFAVAAGSGLCLAGEDNGCAKVYNNLSLLARFGIKDDPALSLAVDGGLVVQQLSDPMLLDIKLGLLGRWMSGKIAIMFNPNIHIGVTERDGNKEDLFVPVMALFMASPQLFVGLQTGIAGPLDGFGDFFVVPLGVGAHYQLNANMGFGAAFLFNMVAGGSVLSDAEVTGFDSRSLTLWFSWMK